MFNSLIGEFKVMKKIIGYVIAIITFSALTACGSGSSDTTADQSPQGLWIGTTNTGYELAAIVLENGDYYSLYSQDGIIIGANYGRLTTTDNTFTGTLKDIYVPNNKTNSGTISGSFVPKSALQGVSVYDDNKVGAFTTTYRESYDTPATLDAITGQYSAPIFRSSLIATLDIDEDGTVNGFTQRTTTTLPSCIISGNVVPRASGKNVYDLTLFWNNNPDPNAPICCNPGSSICATGTPTTGVAVINGNYLYTAWINVANTGGFLWRGLKQ
jgi:hypothetical protein